MKEIVEFFWKPMTSYLEQSFLAQLFVLIQAMIALGLSPFYPL